MTNGKDAGHGSARRHSRDPQTRAIDRVPAGDVVNQTRDETSFTVAFERRGIKPVPATQWVRRAALLGIQHGKPMLIRDAIHLRAFGEYQRVLLAAMEHQEQCPRVFTRNRRQVQAISE